MIAALRPPARRITFAIALSVLLHIVLLRLPHIQLPHVETPLPPLAAKLEPLPQRAATPAAKPRRIPPEPVSASPLAEPYSTVAAAPIAEPTPVVETPPPVETAPAIEAAPAVETAPAVEEEPQAAHPLPRRAQLTFAVDKGLNGLRIGEVRHVLELSGDEYILKAETKTIGLARLFKNYLQIQTSSGKTGKHGLQPELFEDEKTMSDGKQSLKATFDRAAQKLRFSHGGEVVLPDDAQDILSIFYQLSQLRMNREIIPIFISNGKKLEKYELVVGAEEEIITPLGKLRALPLRKKHAQGEEGFEIWLGLEYRLLPVKIRPIERSGEVTGEITITDIRIADE